MGSVRRRAPPQARLDNRLSLDVSCGCGASPTELFRARALIDGPLHGYAIARRARELSGGRVRLSTGTLYALLERALSESLVIAGDPYVEGGRQRRDYTLTPAGRALLADEAAQLAHAARAVSGRLRATSKAVFT